MRLTHDFKETIRARAQAEPEFRQALLRETIECIINGDLATGKAVLRDYVNATEPLHGGPADAELLGDFPLLTILY
jgi:hypothetical protein